MDGITAVLILLIGGAIYFLPPGRLVALEG